MKRNGFSGLASGSSGRPIHSRVITKNAIRFAPNQETFDNEIRAAEIGGLSYWAYLAYGNNGVIDLNHPMMRGLAFHQSSAIKSRIKYALITQTNTWVPRIDTLMLFK